MLDQTISEIFSLDGPLAAHSPGYRVRPAQIELDRKSTRLNSSH